jgi:uncharacterized protein (TIGR03437 family)
MLSSAARALLAGLSVARLLAGADEAARRFAPSYASSTIVQAASQESGPFAPNSILTLYGKDLSYVSRAIQPSDIRDGLLPTVLAGTGVRVYIDNVPIPLYFVSPDQVNLLVPANVNPGLHRLHLALDGRAGPVIDLPITPAAPGLFLQQPGWAIAVRLDGSLVTAASPAAPGDIVILFATGLGSVTGPALRFGELARGAAALVAMDRFAVKLNGIAVPRDHVYYAGLAPGFAGLYQINLRLPDNAPADPEVRVAAGDAESQAARVPVSVGTARP